MNFTHLHVRSHYSLLNGLASITDLIAAAQKHGLSSLALTDTSNLYGAVEFAVAAKSAGIHPIFGCEIRITSDMHDMSNTPSARKSHSLVLLVENESGYANLMHLITAAHLEGFHHEPRIDKTLLRRHAHGLIALSGWLDGEIPERLVDNDIAGAEATAREFAEIFGADHFYLEMQHHPESDRQSIINAGCRGIAKKCGLPLIVTTSVHYIAPTDAAVLDVASCIAHGRKVEDTDRPTLIDFDLSFRSPESLYAAFADTPEAITNTEHIAQRCQFTIPLGNTQLPHYSLPDGITPDAALRAQCEEALHARWGDAVPKEYRERMEYELRVITKTGYASYFLIVQDFVNWAKRHGIVVGPGRGSAAGSFVSYLTGITNIDPIAYHLLFERFLNPERISMPDVDMDFADDRRDDVLHYVRQKYGADHVAQIITFGTMAARAAIRDAGRALNYPYSYCDQLSKMIPPFTSIANALTVSPEFAEAAKNPDARKLIDTAQRLEGVARHTSVHACGVVITAQPVETYTPLQRVAGDDEAVVTQYASSTKFSSVEKIGLLKMDFLGLKNLTIIQNTLRIVHKVRDEHVAIDDIPLDDTAAFTLLQEGRTTGVFQLESSGMKRYLKQLKPTVLEDIIAMVALYRPGPMEWIPDFIDGKHGRKTVQYLHPRLEPILKDTYGVAIYQEQVMRIAQDLAGFTMGEADILRKAMGKKILELIKEQRIKFVEGCETQGVGRAIGEKVFSFIEPFAGYGFNRSHAACYALIGYQTAYLKAHYPAAFMAALMTSDQTHIDRIAIDVAECRTMGLTVLPPDINESFEDFAVVPGNDPAAISCGEKIRFGLNAIKGVGRDVACAIVAERKARGPYRSLADIMRRLEGGTINKKSLESLAKVGAFDAFAARSAVVENVERILSFGREVHAAKASAQISLFGNHLETTAEISLLPSETLPLRTRLGWEKDLLGLYVSDHPTTAFASYFDGVAHPIAQTRDLPDESPVTIAGVVIAQKKILTKKGQQMLFMTMEDITGGVECLVFPKIYDVTKEHILDGAALLVTGTVSTKDGEQKILVDTITPLTDRKVSEHIAIRRTQQKYTTDTQTQKPSPQKLSIVLPAEASMSQITALSAYLTQCTTGNTRVYITHGTVTAETPFSIAPETLSHESVIRACPSARIIIPSPPLS